MVASKKPQRRSQAWDSRAARDPTCATYRENAAVGTLVFDSSWNPVFVFFFVLSKTLLVFSVVVECWVEWAMAMSRRIGWWWNNDAQIGVIRSRLVCIGNCLVWINHRGDNKPWLKRGKRQTGKWNPNVLPDCSVSAKPVGTRWPPEAILGGVWWVIVASCGCGGCLRGPYYPHEDRRTSLDLFPLSSSSLPPPGASPWLLVLPVAMEPPVTLQSRQPLWYSSRSSEEPREGGVPPPPPSSSPPPPPPPPKERLKGASSNCIRIDIKSLLNERPCGWVPPMEYSLISFFFRAWCGIVFSSGSERFCSV